LQAYDQTHTLGKLFQVLMKDQALRAPVVTAEAAETLHGRAGPIVLHASRSIDVNLGRNGDRKPAQGLRTGENRSFSGIVVAQPLGGAGGQASDIRIQADEILSLKKKLVQELADRPGQPLIRIEEDTDRDFFMSPAEAAEYGLIDKVIDKRPVRAVYTARMG